MAISQKSNYLANISSLRNVTIEEWDIHAAGLSVIKEKKALDEETIRILEKLPKSERTVQEGLLQKKFPQLSEIIVNGLIEVMKQFIQENQISPSAILSIKKDAIFIINSRVQKKQIGQFFNFNKKSISTSYIQLPGKKEFYYNSFTNTLIPKGIPRDGLSKQDNFLLKDISSFMRSWEKVDAETMFKLLSNYRSKYLNLNLPFQTYRELDTGLFRLNNYLAEEIKESDLNQVDITQNYMNYILPIIQEIL